MKKPKGEKQSERIVGWVTPAEKRIIARAAKQAHGMGSISELTRIATLQKAHEVLR